MGWKRTEPTPKPDVTRPSDTAEQTQQRLHKLTQTNMKQLEKAHDDLRELLIFHEKQKAKIKKDPSLELGKLFQVLDDDIKAKLLIYKETRTAVTPTLIQLHENKGLAREDRREIADQNSRMDLFEKTIRREVPDIANAVLGPQQRTAPTSTTK
jgi:hypothetical protein